MDQITLMEFPVICCFCLDKSLDLKLISDIPYINLFTLVTGIKLKDALPKNICLVCTKLFEDFHCFIEKSKRSFDILKNILEDSLLSETENSHCTEHTPNCFNDNIGIKNLTIAYKETVKSRKLERSKRGTSKNVRLYCEKCNVTFSNKKMLAKHQQLSDCLVKNQILSDTCTKQIDKIYLENQKREIESSTTNSRKNTCGKCSRSFLTRVKLNRHIKDSPECSTLDYSCSQCKKAFNKKHKLVTHMRSHTKEEPFECEECGKGFRFQQNLRRHMLIHKGVKPFTCEICGKAFSRAHVKNEHMNIHTGNNPYMCMYCGKGFKRYANHFIHVYRHKLINGEIDKNEDRKLYLQLECNKCNKIFASRGGLANHLALHQEMPREKKFLCNECGKGFVTKAQLKSHSRTHTGECPYECSQCGKRFRQKSAYSNHQLIHSGEKPYQCKICEKLFTQSGHLKVHMRVHSGEKPYTCNFCGKSFALKSNLKVHTRIHTGETPYMCAVCGHGYYDSTSLKKHMKSHNVGLPSHGYITNCNNDTNKSFTNQNEAIVPPGDISSM